MPAWLLWVSKDTFPDATCTALQRRNGKAHTCPFGGPGQISRAIAKDLSQYGGITRTNRGKPIVFNGPAAVRGRGNGEGVWSANSVAEITIHIGSYR